MSFENPDLHSADSALVDTFARGFDYTRWGEQPEPADVVVAEADRLVHPDGAVPELLRLAQEDQRRRVAARHTVGGVVLAAV